MTIKLLQTNSIIEQYRSVAFHIQYDAKNKKRVWNNLSIKLLICGPPVKTRLVNLNK